MFKKLLLVSLIISFTGCSSTKTTYTHVSSKPKKTISSLDKVNKCFTDTISEEVNGSDGTIYVLYVDDIYDGTIKKDMPVDGPLGDAGRLKMLSSLYKLHPSGYQMIVANNFPKILGEEISSEGFPDFEQFTLVLDSVKNNVNENRHNGNLPDLQTVSPYQIEGAFTRFDENPNIYGYGSNFQTEEKYNTEISLGNVSEKKYLTLVVNFISPQNNYVVESESFDLVYKSKKNEGSVNVVRKKTGIGYSVEKSSIESVHSAQSTLIEHAALWVMDLLSDQDLSTKCFEKTHEFNGKTYE